MNTKKEVKESEMHRSLFSYRGETLVRNCGRYLVFFACLLLALFIDRPPTSAGTYSVPGIGLPRVTQNANGTVDVTVEIENSKEVFIRNKMKSVVSSGVYDLRLFRDGQLIGTSTPRAAMEAFINAAPRLVAATKASGKLLNTPEDIAWRAANDIFKLKSENIKRLTPDKIAYTFRNVKMPQNGQNEVEFSAYAFNADRVKSETARTKLTLESPKTRQGKTYLVSIGVNASENPNRVLYQSDKVARKTQEILAPRLLAAPENIVGISLISSYKSETSTELLENNATKAKIKAVFSLLGGNGTDADKKVLTGVANVEKIRTVEPEDELIIVYSGHGFRDTNGFFYLLPYDIGSNPAAPDAAGKLISSDELSLWLLDVTAREMIFVIDACNSEASINSEGFKPGPMGSRGLGQLAYDKGIKILAATQSTSAAWQGCMLGQSVLSYALLEEGVSGGKADTQDPKGKLTASEWLNYAETRVPVLHQEVLDGKFGRACSQSQGGGGSGLQTPKLFDFKREKDESPLLVLQSVY